MPVHLCRSDGEKNEKVIDKGQQTRKSLRFDGHAGVAIAVAFPLPQFFYFIGSDYLQQCDGESVAQLWQRLSEPGGSPGCTLLFDPLDAKTLLIWHPQFKLDIFKL